MPGTHHPHCARCGAMIRPGSDWLRLAIVAGDLPGAIPVDRGSMPWPVLSVCSKCREALGQLLAGRPAAAEQAGSMPSTSAIVAGDLGEQLGPVGSARSVRSKRPRASTRPPVTPAVDPPRPRPPRHVAALNRTGGRVRA